MICRVCQIHRQILSITRFDKIFSYQSSGHHRDLHSFPTRRSSDLLEKMPPSRLHFVACAVVVVFFCAAAPSRAQRDRKSTRLNSSHVEISYAVFCLKKKT